MFKISLGKNITNRLKNTPLMVVLVVPFVVQICLTVGVVGAFSFRNGQEAVEELAVRLSEETGDRISSRLDSYLKIPPQINQANFAGSELGLLNLKDFQKVGSWFWNQVKLYEVGYVNFAFENQEFIGAEFQENGQIVINETTLERGVQKTAVFLTNDQGDRTNLQKVLTTPDDVRQEGWYLDAVKAGKPTWSSIYQWDDRPDVLSISHSHPLYDQNKKLVGVLGVDYVLTQINKFLQSLDVEKDGRIFIIERSGLIVGTSYDEQTFRLRNNKPERLNILDSNDSLSRLTAQYMVDKLGGFRAIQRQESLEITLDGKREFIRIQPWSDRYGLDWLIVVVMPESGFMEQIYNRTQVTILLSIGALVIAIAVGILTARSITAPLLNLSGASQAIANGDLDSRVSIEGTSEVKVLSESFNRMAEMLNESFSRLEKANTDLEYRVQQRTSELADSQLSLQHSNFLLHRREQQLQKQQKILIEVTKNKALNLGDFITAVQHITETAGKTLDVERVSVWLFDKSKTKLHCLDLFLQSKNIHIEAEALEADKFPNFFTLLREHRSLAVEDIESDPNLNELFHSYFYPLGIVSLLVSSFDVGSETVGVLMFEQIGVERLWMLEEVSFSSSLADLLSLGMEAQDRSRTEENLRVEKMHSERLLLNVLPKAIAERLKITQTHMANSYENSGNEIADALGNQMTKLRTSGTIVADTFEEVTVLFGDIVGFTKFAASVSASELVHMLNEIFSEFDRLVDHYNLEKIKTIGDSYMVVGGLPLPRNDHAEAIAEMALDMQTSICKFKHPDGSPFELRIGIHTGQAVAGVIGKKKFIYDLWGDTVNIASRMESHGVAGCIQVTDVTYQILKDKYQFEARQTMEIKGKGEMQTYLLKERTNQSQT